MSNFWGAVQRFDTTSFCYKKYDNHSYCVINYPSNKHQALNVSVFCQNIIQYINELVFIKY